METDLKIISVIVILVLGFYIISDIEALYVTGSLEQIVEKSDVIVIGTIQNTWVDVRPFHEYGIVDTAKVNVEEWFKNGKDSDTLEFRYYGYWAQTIENTMGLYRMDMPIHSYESGQKVLLHLSYENPTMVMGEGYYPFYEGTFIIKDDVAWSHTGEQIKLTDLYHVIENHTSDTSVVDDDANFQCSGNELCLTEKIVRIVDGDTIYLDGGHEIRLSLTNTPERHEKGFYEASQFTVDMCSVGTKATVDQDDKQPYDVYGRILGKVVCDNKLLNSELLYAGHANILNRYCHTSEFSDEIWAQEFGC